MSREEVRLLGAKTNQRLQPSLRLFRRNSTSIPIPLHEISRKQNQQKPVSLMPFSFFSGVKMVLPLSSLGIKALKLLVPQIKGHRPFWALGVLPVGGQFCSL